MRKATIFLLMVVGLGSLVACSSDYEPIGVDHGRYFVLVDADKIGNEKGMLQYARTKCKARNFCQVMFWQDGDATPRNFPLTDSEIKSQLMDYNLNRSRHLEKILWNCRLYSNKKSNECF